MLEKIYKIAIITIALFLCVFTCYYILKPDKIIAQSSVSPCVNYAIPEDHVWEAIPNSSGSNISSKPCWLLINKKTGETFYINDYDRKQFK